PSTDMRYTPTRSSVTVTILVLITRTQPTSTLFPYTTLFRSLLDRQGVVAAEQDQVLGPGQGGGLQGGADHVAGVGVVGDQERGRSEEHTSELQSPYDLVCRLLLEKKKRCPIQRRTTILLAVC